MSQAPQVRVRNNVPRVVGLAGQTVVLHPNQTTSVPQETWSRVLRHPLTPRLLSDGVITVLKGDKDGVAESGGQRPDGRR